MSTARHEHRRLSGPPLTTPHLELTLSPGRPVDFQRAPLTLCWPWQPAWLAVPLNREPAVMASPDSFPRPGPKGQDTQGFPPKWVGWQAGRLARWERVGEWMDGAERRLLSESKDGRTEGTGDQA